jgi:hypothetical protein
MEITGHCKQHPKKDSCNSEPTDWKEGGTLMQICADQWSGQWLSGHELTRLKAMNAKDLLKPVKMTLRTRYQQSKDTREMLQCIKNLDLGLSTENCSFLTYNSSQKANRLFYRWSGSWPTPLKRPATKCSLG